MAVFIKSLSKIHDLHNAAPSFLSYRVGSVSHGVAHTKAQRVSWNPVGNPEDLRRLDSEAEPIGSQRSHEINNDVFTCDFSMLRL